ncbi:lysophospholipid acyltransferase family protein [Paenirhodobacter sp.]|uniref:lysophospholipid acyltransferase family protein n=1 Tax=Paenirhodobacter sp. TaxID=1965326 RepID=UPI003B3F7E5C
MTTWYGDPPAPFRRLRGVDWLRIGLRGGALVGVILFGLIAMLILRPWSGRVVQGVCRVALPLLGLRLRCSGAPMRHSGALVANHASWLDIFALNACVPVQFVAKAEVAGWPGIGALARAAGTLFIRRDARDARVQQRAIEDRIRAGHRLVVFPEGTSSDGRRVLPFKSTLFQAFFAGEVAWIQPVTLIYRAPQGQDPRFYGWWGDTGFAPHLAQVLACPGGAVEAIFHPPLRVRDVGTRKNLAALCEATVRAPLDQALSR